MKRGEAGVWLWASLAAAASLAPAELSGTGHVLEPGTAVVHPLLAPSAISLGPAVDVRVPTAAVVWGPWAGLELGLVRTERVAISGSLGGGARWTGEAAVLTARLDASVAAGEGWLSLGVVGGYASADLELGLFGSSLRMPAEIATGFMPRVGLDLPATDKAWVRLSGRFDLLSAMAGRGEGRAGLAWVQSLGRVTRLLVGVGVYRGPNPLSDQPRLVDALTVDPVTAPLPQLELWWRI